MNNLPSQVLAPDQLAERTYRSGLSACEVPAHLHDGLILYLLHHVRPGSFLVAVLENNLKLAFVKADPTSARMLRELVHFLYEWAPHDSWGSEDAVAAWVKGATA